jgi:mannitol-1-/sugar-/sorbitol-6-phosphatase
MRGSSAMIRGVSILDGATHYRCAAVLFDLDGVLVHSDASVERSWQQWAHAHGIPYDLVKSMAHGRRTVDTISELAPQLDPAEQAAALEAAQAEDAADVTAGRGAAEIIGKLRAAEWAVVTSGTRALALTRLRAAGLPEPEVLVCGDDVPQGKPHPDSYLCAAARISLPASQCVVIEDAAAGVRAARRAGMRVIGLTHGKGDAHLAEADSCADWCSDIEIDRVPDDSGVFLVTVRRNLSR